MKFKQSKAINQRIERITMEHLVIGVDIAKEIHVAQAVNFRGMEVGRQLSFSNDNTGFEKFMSWINILKQKHGYTSEIIGMEATGHYWFNLADWLVERQIEAVLVSPMTTKRNKENRDNSQSKNDAKDALVIADCVSRGFYSDIRKHEAVYLRLRCAINEREYWSAQKVSLGNRILRCLDMVFPEFTAVFDEWHCPRAIATLKAFPLPSELRDLSPQEVVRLWREQGMQRAGGSRGLQKAAQLLSKARQSIGNQIMEQEVKRELARLVEDYERIVTRLAQMEQEIHTLLEEVPDQQVELLHSIKGLNLFIIAVILGNAGDLREYAHGRQLLSLAGLNLAESTSGKRKGQIVISKRGRRQLRKYLYLAVMGLATNNPDFKRWHTYNVEVKKMKKQRSIFKLIGKLARIIVGMAHSGQCYVPGKASSLQAA